MIILLVSIAGLLVIFCVIFLVLYVETKKDLSHVKKAISRIVPEKNSPLHILLEKLQGAFEDKIKTIQIQESRNNEILDFRKRLSGTFTINKLVESLRNGINAIQGLDSAYLLLLFPERQLVKLWGVFPETNYLQEEIPEAEAQKINFADSLTIIDEYPKEDMLKNFIFKQSLGGPCLIITLKKTLVERVKGYIFAIKQKGGQFTDAEKKLLNYLGQEIIERLELLDYTSKIESMHEEIKEGKQKSQEEMEKKLRELQEIQNQVIQSSKLNSLVQIGAGIAHELNNPLGGMLGYTQLALTKLRKLSTAQTELQTPIQYLELVERETKRCQELVATFLQFSRRPKDEMLEVDVVEILQNTLSMLQFQLKKKEIAITAEFPEGGVDKVRANANQLQQVFVNLIQNAQQACGQGGHITIKAANSEDIRYRPPLKLITVAFIDNGCGISKENISRIFDPFFTTKLGTGSGLGLSITYTIIRAHGGILKVDSEEGKGSAFTVVLPAYKKLGSEPCKTD